MCFMLKLGGIVSRDNWYGSRVKPVSDWFKARMMKEDSDVICAEISAWKNLSPSLCECCDEPPRPPTGM